MKHYQILLAVSLCILISTTGQTQPDTAKITGRALLFADSLVKADYYNNWSTYADLVPTSILKYYGGKDGYITQIGKIRPRTASEVEEEKPELKLLQLATVNNEWQCVIRESRYFHKADIKYHFITYLVGQSKDEGENWKVFDVSFGSVSRINYFFPEIFGELAISDPVTLTPEQEAAQQQTATTTTAGKKAAPRKK